MENKFIEYLLSIGYKCYYYKSKILTEVDFYSVQFSNSSLSIGTVYFKKEGEEIPLIYWGLFDGMAMREPFTDTLRVPYPNSNAINKQGVRLYHPMSTIEILKHIAPEEIYKAMFDPSIVIQLDLSK